MARAGKHIKVRPSADSGRRDKETVPGGEREAASQSADYRREGRQGGYVGDNKEPAPSSRSPLAVAASSLELRPLGFPQCSGLSPVSSRHLRYTDALVLSAHLS